MGLKRVFACGVISVLAMSQLVHATDDVGQWLNKLQHRWTVNQYQLTGIEQIDAFKALIMTADEAVKNYPEGAELWVWKGIINASYAGLGGGLGALKYAKTGRSDLEKAIAIDDTVLNGSAYTSLGALY